MVDFTGQVAIVTGAGRGLGRHYAIELARHGASVVVNDHGVTTDGRGADASVADGVVDEIGRAGGIAVASHEGVDSREGGEAIVRLALDEFGRLDALVSNAGIFQTRAFEQLSPADWRRMLGVHLDGGFYVSQPAFRVMKAQGYGRLVFIASSAGIFGQPQAAHYAAAKAGLLGLTNVIALEGAEHGILANAVLPFGYSRMVTDTVADREQTPEEIAFLDAIKPELVVPLVVFLASRACDLSHHCYSACAGRFARVFVGLGEGWLADASSAPTADDIAATWARSPPTAPTSCRCRSSTRSQTSAPGWESSELLVRKPLMVIGIAGSIVATVLFALRTNHPDTGYYTFVLILSLLAVFLAFVFTPWLAAFTETVEGRNPALMATGLAVWGWTLRLVVAGSLFVLPYVVTSMTPLVENGSQVQALVARYPNEVATLNAIDPSTQAQLQADPTNTAAINTAVTEISQNLHVSSAVALQDLTAVAQVPRDDLTFLAAHGPEVQRAAAASPGEWRRWWWVCVGGEALLLPFLFVMKGRWSPRRARADLQEHERAVQEELAALQRPRAA